MAREMFGDIVDPSIKVGSRKWYTVPLSIAVHTGILLALVIIPLMAADVLPVPPAMMNAFVALTRSPTVALASCVRSPAPWRRYGDAHPRRLPRDQDARRVANADNRMRLESVGADAAGANVRDQTREGARTRRHQSPRSRLRAITICWIWLVPS